MGSQTPANVASLPIVNYEALINKDAAEISKLVHAAITVGMFYLDLRGATTSAFFEDISVTLETANDFFSLPQDSAEKTEALRTGVERGYHYSPGSSYYEIPRDEFTRGTWPLPPTFGPQKERLARTLQTFHSAVQTVLAELCKAVDITIPELNPDTTIPSDTALKLVYKPPIHDAGKVVSGAHTDFGLATLLWYDEETTQVSTHDDDNRQTNIWQTIPVVEGCALVNVADELAARSGGKLHSTLHRVVAPPGAKRVQNGVLYLMRPGSA
ncbi:oxidoreductase [Aspergillus pseudoustus]|uniref:Oxidoreductase n=1 Tax=Aspergillus pseudoustus TaxID=1810923 RepID=A0ABR4KSY4_9EURO